MDFKTAINALKKLDADNIDELISAVEGHVSRLEEKSYETIGESRKNATKARTLQASLEATAKILGLEGEIETLSETLEAKVRELADAHKAAQTKLSEAESRASSAEGKISTLERQGKLRDIASKVGADSKVLERLLAEQIDNIQISGDAVTLNEKPLKEWIEADAELKPFLPALFPQSPEQPKKPEVKLPSGGPDGKPETKDLVSAYLQRTYTGAKAFSKSS